MLHDAEDLLTPQQVADSLHVSAVTVNKWADAGQIDAVRLPSGRYRFRRSTVEAILAGDVTSPSEAVS